MSNRQAQRDAQRDRRREARAAARREARIAKQPQPSPTLRPKKAPAPPPPAKRTGRVIWGIVGVIAAAVIAVGIYYVVKTTTSPLPGTVYASQGNVHVSPGEGHPPYDSNPPTSGWHYPTWPKRGIYTQVLPEEYLIHFQEHAGVVVHYNPNTLPADQQKLLTNIVEGELGNGQGLVVLSPDPNIPQKIALTSWQHLEAFDFVKSGNTNNTSKIQDFIERLQCNYDPEGVCGTPHGNQFYPTTTPAAGAPTVIGQPIATGIAQGTAAPGQKLETQTPIPAPSATPTP